MSTLQRILELAAVMLATCVLFALSAVVPAAPASEPLRRRMPWVRAVLALCAMAAILSVTACGGGDPEDDSADGRQTVQPPACAQQPELCK